MFAYLKGRITQFGESIVVECNNVGYEVFVSSFTMEKLKAVEGETKVLTYYQQKEDGVCLYGFFDQEEKDIFLKLISVSGLGPKGAMAILSNVTPHDLSVIIAKQDLKSLSSVKGIGKKTAERLLVELKDKVCVFGNGEAVVLTSESNREIDDACEVLFGLGLSKNEALKLAQSCYKSGDSAEDIISKSLSQMRK